MHSAAAVNQWMCFVTRILWKSVSKHIRHSLINQPWSCLYLLILFDVFTKVAILLVNMFFKTDLDGDFLGWITWSWSFESQSHSWGNSKYAGFCLLKKLLSKPTQNSSRWAFLGKTRVVKERFVFLDRRLPKREDLGARRATRFCSARWGSSRYRAVKRVYMRSNCPNPARCPAGEFMSSPSHACGCARGRRLPGGSKTWLHVPGFTPKCICFFFLCCTVSYFRAFLLKHF